MTEREKLINLIEELVDICPPDCSCSEVIAHFILEDRARICEPLVRYKKTQSYRKWNTLREDKYIDETLKLASLKP